MSAIDAMFDKADKQPDNAVSNQAEEVKPQTVGLAEQKVKVGAVTFYSCVDHQRCIMPNGKELKFAHGMFTTADPKEIEHLMECVSSAGVVSLEPVKVIENDALVMKEVGAKGNTGTGAMSSNTIAQLTGGTIR